MSDETIRRQHDVTVQRARAESDGDVTVRRSIRWQSVQQTHVGKVRDVNEDALLSCPVEQLWVVADGMGGYEAGDVASDMVVQSLESIQKITGLSAMADEVEDRLLDVNQGILDYAELQLKGRTLGSTVVSLFIQEKIGVCLWAGDSRLYRFRDDRLEQISRDHSQIEELLAAGQISPEEALTHPGGNIITRAIGASPEIFIDVTVFTAKAGDRFLLCSDGLYNMVPEEIIAKILSDNPLEDAIDALIGQTLENGARDNVSIILVEGVTDIPEA